MTSLALAIGLNVLLFSFTSPVLLKGLPYPDLDRLLDISMAPPGKPDARGPLTPPLYFLLRDRTAAAFDAVGVFDAGRSANLSGDAGGPAVRLAGHRITSTGLAALGAAPIIGRLPVATDEATGAPQTMLLSYPLWQRRFGARPDIVGQTVQVDGQSTLIVGVMPQGFGLLDGSSDAWFTFGFVPSSPAQETQHALRGVGRLKPGVSIAEAQASVRLAVDEYARTFPDRDEGWTVELTPWREARFGGLRRPLAMVQIGAGAILFLVCVSVAVLMRARTVLRARSAVGSRPTGPAGVVGQSLTLPIAGGAIAILVVALGLPSLLAMTPPALPRLSDVTFGAGELAFAIVLSVVAGLLLGIVPAARASRIDTATKGWLGAIALVVLVALQAALAFVLIAGAALAMRAVGDLRGREVGINPAGLLSADVFLPREPYVTRLAAEAGSPEMAVFNPAGAVVFDRIRESLQRMPGVVQAAGVGTQPFSNAPFVQCFIGDAEHTPENQVAAQYLAVTENYFNTMGIRIVRGRDFTAADRPDSPWVVLVNETLAKQHWSNGDPIGQRLTLTFSPNDEEPAREVVGLVADTLPFRGASEVPPLIYVLHRQQATEQRASLESRRTVMSFVVRTTGDPRVLGDAVRAQVGNVDATTPVSSIRTVESYLNAGQTALLQYGGTMLVIFAIVALAASALGICALTAYGLAHRQSMLTFGLFVAAAVVIGGAAGLAAWLRLGSVIESFLTNLTVTPSDPLPLVVTGGVLVVTALIACLVPARRATRAAAEIR